MEGRELRSIGDVCLGNGERSDGECAVLAIYGWLKLKVPVILRECVEGSANAFNETGGHVSRTGWQARGEDHQERRGGSCPGPP